MKLEPKVMIRGAAPIISISAFSPRVKLAALPCRYRELLGRGKSITRMYEYNRSAGHMELSFIAEVLKKIRGNLRGEVFRLG